MKLKKISKIVLMSVVFATAHVITANANVEVADATFNSKYYAETYADLKGLNEAQLRNHFATDGVKEGRVGSPAFDVKYYLENNGDLKAKFGNDYEAAYNHFVNHAIINEPTRATSPVFDVKYYVESSGDLAAAFGTNYKRAYEHFSTYGILTETRTTTANFDAKTYLENYADLQKAFGKENYLAAYAHYMGTGRFEGRTGAKLANAGAPVISGVKEETVYVNLNDKKYTIPEATAKDAKDGNVKVNVEGEVDVKKAGTYTVTYTAKNKAGKEAKVVLTVVVDNSAPVIEGISEDTVYLKKNAEYTLPEVTAKDLVDGDVTANITREVRINNVVNALEDQKLDTSSDKTYKITYKVVDTLENKAEKTLNVIVDCTAPKVAEIEVKRDVTTITEGTVKVTVTAKEAIQCPEGWEYATKTDGTTIKTSIVKAYTENVVEEIQVKDLAGNEAVDGTGKAVKTKIEVNNISKGNPVVTINGEQLSGEVKGKIYNKNVTMEFVNATATLYELDNKGTIVATANIETGRKTGTADNAEKNYKLVVTDYLGRKTSIEFTVDMKKPEITAPAMIYINKNLENKVISKNDATASNALVKDVKTDSDATVELVRIKDPEIKRPTDWKQVDTTDPWDYMEIESFKADTKAEEKSNVADTRYVARYVAVDKAGNKSEPIEVRIVVDFTAPKAVAMRTGKSDAFLVNSGIYKDLKIRNSVEDADVASMKLDGKDYAAETAIANGAHTFVITDNAGNSTTYSFTVDNVAPKVTYKVNDGEAKELTDGAAISGGLTKVSKVTLSFDKGSATLTKGSASWKYNQGETITIETAGSYTLSIAYPDGETTTYTFTVSE